MPLYEYTCRQCKTRFEELVMGSGATPRCPSCRSADLERMMSVFAVSQGGLGDRGVSSAMGACGSCGDPRGPGACKIDPTN
jgi:putative FmdB family regulatory protein